ncbi:MAG: hypothetical protein D6736_18735 [Nitrospinota bacterium]|nr:MAG: hypothetical protein D6736_18735 [Nitrospinota bacterium]
MDGSHTFHLLSSDKPVVDPNEDRLGYAPFAKHLAESIGKMTPTEGLVIGIYGPWDSGKTTLLNFILHLRNLCLRSILSMRYAFGFSTAMIVFATPATTPAPWPVFNPIWTKPSVPMPQNKIVSNVARVSLPVPGATMLAFWF